MKVNPANAVIIASGREKSIRNRHPWIFSGAISKTSGNPQQGELVKVQSSSGETLGYGTFSPKGSVRVRMITFDPSLPSGTLISDLAARACCNRVNDPFLRSTDAFRLIFAEADSLPGLVVDNFAGHLVVQSSDSGADSFMMEALKGISAVIDVKSVFERSDHSGRAVENLKPKIRQISGTTPEEIIFHEDNLKIRVDVRNGQKTGFFLDQRDNRRMIRELASGKTVINICSYTGGMSLAAAQGGAVRVISVDSSEDALEGFRKNLALNSLTISNEDIVKADMFRYIRDDSETISMCDLLIIDPPAFAKARNDVNRACRGYKELNMKAMQKMKKGSLLLTCSCSRHISRDLYRKVIFGAAVDAQRDVVILREWSHPSDHPINICHQEGEYLKSMLLRIE
ncbi:MAG: hypothetical protein CVV64_09925 [Candidatus Wallbacteria bacterium HGW-Wallbacteria-1]|jgi:23S rRNA (cytosine1962-C5)-methyltransferase|uniref:PUA domain-containing protein n=1 Tax=Candidatus Wallbacteria bacterium HGW-Wallbacteria-1 TaxID=2013854 RepID=A0A2N1PPL8_9BACT|nr:MAG: hypothetical protein CVV64_09925 [Candidatus Wallbacteria bacterium HGW-Wallbacteria-1]